jgi:hypothetical protein
VKPARHLSTNDAGVHSHPGEGAISRPEAGLVDAELAVLGV